METDFKSYTRGEIYDILERTREIAGEPYKIFAGLVLSGIYDQILIEDEEIDEERSIFSVLFDDKRSILKEDLDNIVKECICEFADAIKENSTVEICNKPYSIRRPNTIDIKKLRNIVRFPENDGMCEITTSGIMNLEFGAHNETARSLTELSQDNILFFKKLVYLAESNDGDGIDVLTDMEATAYYYCKDLLKAGQLAKIDEEYFDLWYERNKEFCGTRKEDIKNCWTLKARTTGTGIGNSTYCFSANEIRLWNKTHGQPSSVDIQDKDDACQYWFDTASKKSFRFR